MDDVVNLYAIAEALELLEARLLDLADDDGGLAGSGPSASENRAVVAARLLLVRQRTKAMCAEIAAVRRRSTQMAQDAVAQRTRTAWERASRARSPSPTTPPHTPGTRIDEPLPPTAGTTEAAARTPSAAPTSPPCGVGPSPAHRRFAAAMRDGRRLARLSHGDVAAATGLSRTKVARIEEALALPSRAEARRWGELFGATEGALGGIDALLEQAQSDRTPWAEVLGSPHGHLQDRVAADEHGAGELRSVALTAVPGLLQTAEYARAWIPAVDATAQIDHDAAVQARLARQHILGQPTHHVMFLLTEHVLHHADRIAPGQRAHLERMAALPGVQITVLATSFLTCRTGYTIFDRKRDGSSAHVDVELLHGDLRISHPRDVGVYQRQFTHMLQHAIPLSQH